MSINETIDRLRDALDDFESTASNYVDVTEERDFSTEEDDELIDEIGHRLFDDSLKSICLNIVQKHRLGQDWQTDALEVIYNIANKVV